MEKATSNTAAGCGRDERGARGGCGRDESHFCARTRTLRGRLWKSQKVASNAAAGCGRDESQAVEETKVDQCKAISTSLVPYCEVIHNPLSYSYPLNLSKKASHPSYSTLGLFALAPGRLTLRLRYRYDFTAAKKCAPEPLPAKFLPPLKVARYRSL